MRPSWMDLSETGRLQYRITIAFIENRLEERRTIDWALDLSFEDKQQKLAVVDLLSRIGQNLKEPWRSAWRLIELSWTSQRDDRELSNNEYSLKTRILSGENSISLVSSITELVAPRFLAKPHTSAINRKVKVPKNASDLFSYELVSGDVIKPDDLGINNINDETFLLSLARSLEAALNYGLAVAESLGWDTDHQLWRFGFLYRVYYVPENERLPHEDEPDKFHRGIAPVVKLLDAIVQRLLVLNVEAALPIVKTWNGFAHGVYLRLWASVVKNHINLFKNEIDEKFLQLDDKAFWDVSLYPEVSQLRAYGFGILETSVQKATLKRIIRKPPRKHWRGGLKPEVVANAREYVALRELKRISIAGNDLPERYLSWFRDREQKHPELNEMENISFDFIGRTKSRVVPPNPDERYDSLSGKERLKALETAFLMSEGWFDCPHSRAVDWLNDINNARLVLQDFLTLNNSLDEYPQVLERFGWSHSLRKYKEVELGNTQEDAETFILLMSKFSDSLLMDCCAGLSHWLGEWKEFFILEGQWFDVWKKIWPCAVIKTNESRPDNNEVLSVELDSGGEPDIDTLNQPIGKLVGIFIDLCPNLQEVRQPFVENVQLQEMRGILASTDGYAGLIAKHRLIECLPYFLRADSAWTNSELITPLKAGNNYSLYLWKAVSYRVLHGKALEVIGNEMIERSLDKRLGKRTRKSLVFSLVLETLYAFLYQRDSAIPTFKIQQMLRLLDDEIRSHAAETLIQFIEQLPGSDSIEQELRSPELIYDRAIVNFIKGVWPQEKSLTTPGVSKSFSEIPAASKGRFSDAVELVIPFIVPFDCWHLMDFGLYGDPGLSLIDSSEKAEALIKLLDNAIGRHEGCVAPTDLSDALQHIRSFGNRVSQNQEFRRLEALARRR